MRAKRRIAVIGLVLATSALGVSMYASSSVANATTYAFHCSSNDGSSTTSYTVTGSVPGTVKQGATFSLSNVVVTGTPPVDLLIKTMNITFGVSAGANVSSLHEGVNGPGSQTPVGPVAPAGTPNSTSPQTFSLVATGAVGTVISFTLIDVASVVLNPNDHAQQLSVDCTPVRGAAFALTKIVKQGGPRTTTTTTRSSTTTTSSSSTTTTTTTPKHCNNDAGTISTSKKCNNDTVTTSGSSTSGPSATLLSTLLVAFHIDHARPSLVVAVFALVLLAIGGWVLRRYRAF